MLDFLKEKLETHLQAAVYSIRSFRSNLFSLCVTGLIITATLSMPVSFWIVSQSLQKTLIAWQKAAHVALYFKMGTTTETVSHTLNALKQDKAVQTVSYIPPEEGLKILTAESRLPDLTRYLPTNPLPAMIEVTLKDAVYTSSTTLDIVCKRFKTLPGIELVELDTQWLNQLHTTLSFVRVFMQGMMGLLLLAVIFIIGHTLRLTLYQRFEEMQILTLLGADNAYIMRPFLYAGIGYGLLGAMGTTVCVSILLLSLHTALHTFALFSFPTMLSISQVYAILFISIFLGFTAAQITVRRALSSLHLKNPV